MSILHRAGTTLSKTAQNFVRNRDGNISLLFGLTLIPLVAAAGSAVDYSRASQARAQLQAAADSTALAVARRAPTLTDAQLRAEAQQHFRAVLSQRADLAALPITVTRTSKRVQITAAGAMPTTFMKLFGTPSIDVGTRVEAGFGDRKVELMLALDNTGSMAQLNKMTELKKAAQNLITTASAAAPAGSGMIKVGLVPFDTDVRVEPSVYRNQSWMAYRDNAAAAFNDVRGRMADLAGWGGCLTDRNVGYDTNDRRAQLALAESLHPAVNCRNNLAKVQPLTDNWSALRTAVDSMQPSGCTNVTIGARFGLAGLSPTDVLGAGAAPLGDANTDKYLVILTDGDNTQNRAVNGCTSFANTSSIDDKTRAMCADIKGKTTNGKADIKVFTIRVMAGNQALLRDCATNASMYKEVNDAAQIDAVFRDIIREITALRLTM